MAALTEGQLVTLRRQVGSSPTDGELQLIFDRVGSLTETAREVLEIRLANLRAEPTSFTVPGEYSQDTSGQIKALDAQLAKLGDLDNTDPVDDAAAEPTVRVVRAARTRR